MTSYDSTFIAYILHVHPSLHTTFIRREIDALRGLRVEAFSLRPCDIATPQGDVQALAPIERTHYLPERP